METVASSHAGRLLMRTWTTREAPISNSSAPVASSLALSTFVCNIGTVFCDQAYWQSSVATKPLQGVWGFISGGLVWFAIPFTLATIIGLAYLGLSSAQVAPMSLAH